jgi:nucleotide-binding universal stress UspA family protein
MIRVQNILCPVDFFPASERAADYAAALASNYDAKLTLLHVVSPLISSAYEVPMNVEQIIKSMMESANAGMKRVAGQIKRRNVPVETIVRAGDIDSEILDQVAKRHADMLVMGTHGGQAFGRWFLGSHTERLLRRLPIPVLTIGPGKAKAAPPAIRRILVTTDFSEGTPDAMDYAFSIAQECQARVTLLHVIDEMTINYQPRYRGPLFRSIGDELEKLVPEEARNWCRITARVESGTPVNEILKVLKRERVDLVVMNIHGKGMLDRALLGSTAERVVRGAGVPVLLIPPLNAGKSKKRPARKVA